MSESALKVKHILQNNYINEGHYTHVSLIIPRGKYSLSSRPLLEKFWHYYCTSLQEKPSVDYGIAEVPQLYIPILVDVDLKFAGDEMKYESGHYYSEDLVRKLISVYQKFISELVVFKNDEDRKLALICFWLEKEAYSLGEGIWKNGFHLHFPNLFVNRIEQETRIIPAVKKFLEENFETYGIDSSIIDSKAVGNTWLLYGSVKAEHMKPYKVAAAYDHEGKSMNLKEALISSAIYDEEEKVIPVTEENFEFYLPRIFSILLCNRKHFEIRKDAKCIRIAKPFVPAAKRESRVDNAQIEGLVKLLSPKRAEGHNDWMSVGWTLFNLTDGSDKGLDLWIKFSSQTEDHNEDRCIYEWSRMTNRGTITLGTLKHFARIDNPVGYKKFISMNNTKRENYSEFGLAELLYEFCQEEFVYCDRSWYVFGEHYWEEDSEALIVRARLIQVLKTLLDSINKERTNSIPEEEDGKGDSDPRKDPALNARARLNTISFVNSILEFSKLKFARKDFTRNLNKNKYLVGFKNGVFDLKAHVFRKGHPSDMITNYMKISYKEFEDSDPLVIELLQFLQKVFPNEKIRIYFMDIMSEIFVGFNHRKKVYFWTGDGDNGKSMTQMLFSKMLSTLCVKAPTTLVTSKRAASGSATPELSRLGNGVRVVFLEEPDPSEEIYQGIFKHLSGNDDYYARDLYQSGKEVVEIQPMFKIMFICNSLPRVKGGGDKATWNRVRVIPFESTFRKDAPLLVEEQFAKKVFPVDTSLDQKIPSWIEPLAWYLLRHSRVPRCEDPEEVLAATLEYQTENDMLVSFMKIHMVEDEDGVANKFALYDMYKEFCRDRCSGKRPLTFMEFMKCALKKFGNYTSADGEGWKGYRVKSAQVGLVASEGAKSLI